MGNGTRSAPGATASPARPSSSAVSASPHPLLKAGIPPTEAPHSRATPSPKKSSFIQPSEEPFGSQLTLFHRCRPKPPPHLLSSPPEHPLHPWDAIPRPLRVVLTAPSVSWDPARRRKEPPPNWGPTCQAVTLKSPSCSPGVPQHSIGPALLQATARPPLVRPRPKNK